MVPPGLNLLFDADDTLWSNAVLFESAFESWLNLVTKQGADREAAATLFTTLEHQGFRRGWYGSRRLAINMKAVARQLLPQAIATSLNQDIDAIVNLVRSPEVLIFDGVQDTLQKLGKRHVLLLVTMGERNEQLEKVKASGLAPHFSAIHVLADKTRDRYDAIIRSPRMERRNSWMIGNSLTKDIQPAKAAGLKTCYIANGLDFDFGLKTNGTKADLAVGSFPALDDYFGEPR